MDADHLEPLTELIHAPVAMHPCWPLLSGEDAAGQLTPGRRHGRRTGDGDRQEGGD